MSWSNTNVRSEQVKFLGDWLKEKFSFTRLCQHYGISRKTGYKLVNRFQEEGEAAFQKKSHARISPPNVTPPEIQARVIQLKKRYPHWGPNKLRDWLLFNEPQHSWPAKSTLGEILKRHGLVKSRRYSRRAPPYTQPFLDCEAPNDIWSADFKGQFRVGEEGYCYPLTLSDNFSRFLLLCEGLVSPCFIDTKGCFDKVFYEYGLPDAIRTDNGQPFAGTGIGGLTRLSIWWLQLGILPERIAPGCPQQNGRHERMHRTLKQETASPAEKTFREQQERFDSFKQEYNFERPHEALGGQRPCDHYTNSLRSVPNSLEMIYPTDFEIRKVRTNGEIRWAGKKYFLSELLVRQPIGFEVIDDGQAIVYFGRLQLGIIDAREDKIIRL